MAIISFNNQVLSAFGQTPSNLSWSLSSTGTYKTVELLTTGTGTLASPTLSAKKVRGVVFNTLTSPASGTGVWASLSAFSGTTFRVDAAYNGQTMGLIYDDDSSTLFTVVTGATTTKQSLTANGFDTSYPEIKRLWTLGYI
jgi:hypothetical protein